MVAGLMALFLGSSGCASAAASRAAGPNSRRGSSPAVRGDRDFYLVMIGNSIQGTGIDFPALSQAIGHPVKSLGSGGAMSAWKFATLWHVSRNTPKPKYAIVVTRRNYITSPTRRVSGKYEAAVQKAIGTDPELQEIVNELAHPGDGRAARGGFDCAKSVARSFLPRMIRVAKEKRIQLIIVRGRSRAFASSRTPEPVKKRYAQDLAAYLESHGVFFLDYQDNPAIKFNEHYSDGDHLNAAGRKAWTPIVAADLKAILTGKRATHEQRSTPGAEARRATSRHRSRGKL